MEGKERKSPTVDEMRRAVEIMACFAANQGRCDIKGGRISGRECRSCRFKKPERDVTNGKRYPVDANYGRPGTGR